MDESAALLSAAVGAFTEHKSTNEYLSSSMRALQGEKTLSKTFIRIDRSHYIATLMRCRKLKKFGPHIRRFVLKAFGFFIQCLDLEKIVDGLKALFVVCRSKYQNDAVKNGIAFFREMDVDIEISEEKAAGEFYCTDSKDYKNIGAYQTTANYDWVSSIYDSVVQEATVTNADEFPTNTLCAPKLKTFLLYQMVRLPLWGNIMVHKYRSKKKYASSSGCESEFRKIKNLVGVKTKRPDVFVKNHLQSLDGILKMDQAYQKYLDVVDAEATIIEKRRSKSLSEIRSPVNTSDVPFRSQSAHREMYVLENWKDRAAKVPTSVALKRSHKSILNLSPSQKDAPLLKNGYVWNNEKGHRIIVQNTCAFDSVFSIFCTAYENIESLKNKFHESGSNITELMASACSRDVDAHKIYQQRTESLRRIYSSKLHYKGAISADENVTRIDCFTGIAPFFSRLVEDGNSILCSTKKTKSCSVCYHTTTAYEPLLPLELSKLDLGDIQKSITTSVRVSHCEKCGGQNDTERENSDIVVLDVDVNKSSAIQNIQQNIILSGAQYILFGVIQHKGNHFIAHVRDAEPYWTTYNDLADEVERKKKTRKTEMVCCLLFYIKEELYTLK